MIPFVRREALVWLFNSERDTRVDIAYKPGKKLYYQDYVVEVINYPMTNPKAKWERSFLRHTLDHAKFCIRHWGNKPERRYRIKRISDGKII